MKLKLVTKNILWKIFVNKINDIIAHTCYKTFKADTI